MPNIVIIGASRGIGAAIARSACPEFDIYTISRTYPEPCPGSINLKPFNNCKLEDFRKDLELNLLGAVRCLQHYQPLLMAAESASIVLFSSVAAQVGFPYHSIVSASKGAIEGLTHALAAEWAPKIRVNAIAPSLTDTPLAERLLREDSKKETAALRHPLKRVDKAEDIADLALFLLSEKSSWVTGQVMHVDGGVSTIRG